VMAHVNHQYSPRPISALAGLIASDHCDMILGSRIPGNGVSNGEMSWRRYIANRALAASENVLIGQELSGYHTGLRAWPSEVLESLPLKELSDDFVFDSQTLALAVLVGANIGEISCPTRYMSEASSINFRRSIRYRLGVVSLSFACRRALHRKPRGVFVA
jgi:hypothetical protein